MDNLILIGAGGHSRVIIDAIKSNFGWVNYRINGIIDINYNDKSNKTPIFDIPIIGGFEQINQFDKNITSIIISIGDNNLRKQYFNEVKNKGFKLQTIIHRTAIVSKYSNIGYGTFINAGAIVNADCKIGDNVIINTGSIIEHECKIGDNVHIAPGVKLAGRINIGNDTFVGIGSVIIQNINIGNNVLIGAGSVVTKDIIDNKKVAGIPAKSIIS